jgi:monothiol glutaredoxin
MEQGKSLEEWTAQIRRDVAEHRVFVYAKGEKGAAVCGYSRQVMLILDHVGVPYEVRNIFSDPNLRPALCAYTDWPTTPQVFIDGEFVGGCDILTEMHQSGELKRRLAAEPSETR